MKKIMIATLGLSLLSGTAVFAAQNSSAGAAGQSTDNGNMSGKKHKKHKKSKKSDAGTTDSSAAPKA
jgi:uncharacterized protein YxeA